MYATWSSDACACSEFASGRTPRVGIDPRKAAGQRLAFNPATADFEILPGTAPKTSTEGLKPFEMPDLTPAEMAGD